MARRKSRVIAKGLDAMNDSLVERILTDKFDDEELPLEEIPALMIKLAAVQSSLSARLLGQPALDRGNGNFNVGQLLNVTEAARQLNVSTQWLYRNAKKLPFAMKLGQKQLRFSASGIEKYLRTRRAK